MVSDPKAYMSLFKVAEKRAQQVLPVFQAELAKKATWSWNDPPLDPAWKEPDASQVREVETADGILTDRFAFCQTMPIDEFLTAAESLRRSRYRPIRFRPYADRPVVRVAAVWVRDGRDWRISSGLSADAVRQLDERNKNDGFLPVDVAGYVKTDNAGKETDRYAALWVEKSGDDDAGLYVGMIAEQETEVQTRRKHENLIPRTQHAMIGSDGRTRYCGVMGRPPGAAVTGTAYRDQFQGNFEQSQAEQNDQLVIDLAISGAARPQTIRDRMRPAPESADKKLEAREDRDDPASAGIAHPDRRYAAVKSNDPSFETIPIFGLDPAVQETKCRELIAQGYRPRSWSVTRTNPQGPLVTASVWHRPVLSDLVKDRLAERQARAAVALVRMGKAEAVWPLLQYSADPGLRSFIINWLCPLGADPKLIAAEFDRIEPGGAGATPPPPHAGPPTRPRHRT